MSTGPQVTFTSDFFKPIAGEEEEANPGRFGKALAQWLAEQLKERGVSVEGVIPEDFEWVIMVSRKPFMRAPRKTSACPPLVKLHRPDPCCSLSR